MTQSRTRRSLVALVAAATVILTGCAVPSQPEAPGVAGEFHGRTITNDHIDAVHDAWLQETEGEAVPLRSQVLTIDLLTPELVAAAGELGVPITDGDATTYAKEWLKFAGPGGEPSDYIVEATKGVLALTVIEYQDPTREVLTAIAEEAEAEAVMSPRSGDFNADAFMATVDSLRLAADQQELGPFVFTSFQHVDGFMGADSPWLQRD